jgi:hydrogenase maturation protease
MGDLRRTLTAHLRPPVCLVGVGNPDRGDDGFGLRLAAWLADRGVPHVVLAERTPERWVETLARGGFRSVLFLDAVRIGADPGDAVFLTSAEIVSRYPQVSTHAVSLGTLARLIEADGPARVFLLGVQPRSLTVEPGLSEPVRTTLRILEQMLLEILTPVTEPLAIRGERP